MSGPAAEVQGLGSDLAVLYGRELDRLVKELEAYPEEALLWSVQGEQRNRPGNLALHVAGNLLYYVGDGLAQTGYVRDRAAEFESRDLPREELIRRLHAARAVVTDALANVSDVAMGQAYPGTPPSRMEGITTRAFLLHLLWHVGWHTGQVYYHRLALTSSAGGAMESAPSSGLA